jgi:hypothetical protein
VGDKEGTFNLYAMGFDVPSDLDPSLCKFDVADQNMVVILKKAAECEGFWLEPACPDSSVDGGLGSLKNESVSSQVLKPRPYKSAEVASSMPESKDVVVAGKTTKLSDQAVDRLVFASSTAIYELD